MAHESEFHAKLISAPRLGPGYALLYVRFNSSGSKSLAGWTDNDIQTHIDSTYQWLGGAPPVVLLDGYTNKPTVTHWSKSLQSKRGNNIRHLFLLVPVTAPHTAEAYEHNAQDLERDTNDSMYVLRQEDVLDFAVTLAYSELKKRDPNWMPTVSS